MSHASSAVPAAPSAAIAEDLNPFRIAQRQFDQAAPYVPLLRNGLADFLNLARGLVPGLDSLDGATVVIQGFGNAGAIAAELFAAAGARIIAAALENQIRGDNAERVRARLIVEAANGPTTPEADRILSRRGIPVLPDILANSGGVTVSYSSMSSTSSTSV